jgi:hypothetical protein
LNFLCTAWVRDCDEDNMFKMNPEIRFQTEKVVSKFKLTKKLENKMNKIKKTQKNTKSNYKNNWNNTLD